MPESSAGGPALSRPYPRSGEVADVIPAWLDAPRIGMVADGDRACADLVELMIEVAIAALPYAYLDGKFAHTVRRGSGQEGLSIRYSLIATMGLGALPPADQHRVLGSDDCDRVLGILAGGLEDMTSRGDVALMCWAAAESGHAALPQALGRAEGARPAGPRTRRRRRRRRD